MQTIPLGLMWKLRRVAAGRRQTDVAQEVGVSSTRLSQLERGETVPTALECNLLEQALPTLDLAAEARKEQASHLDRRQAKAYEERGLA